MTVTVFQQQVYDLCSQIPKGKVSTYKEIAQALGKSGFAYRAVGMALNKNPFAPKVPCHRVVSTNGSLGGFAFGNKKKVALLLQEGVHIKDNKILDFSKKLYRF